MIISAIAGGKNAALIRVLQDAPIGFKMLYLARYGVRCIITKMDSDVFRLSTADDWSMTGRIWKE